MSSIETHQHLEDGHYKPEERETYIERVVDNLDARLFIEHFFQPLDPQDSLEYMAVELITPKTGERLKKQAELVQELLHNSSSRQLVENFVTQDYQLKAYLSEREEILKENLGEIDFIVSYRSKMQKYNKSCYNGLTAFDNLIRITQQLDNNSWLLRKLKKVGEDASQNEIYQATAAMIESINEFGYGNIGVRYDYFEKRVAPQRIKMEKQDRWLETAKWYTHITGASLGLLLSVGIANIFPEQREKLFTRFMHDAVEKNLSSMQKILEWRKTLDFFLGGIRFTQAMKEQGLPLTFPQFTNDKRIVMTGLYNPCLLLQKGIKGKEDIVANDVEISPTQTVNILTGPNYCGKSVYIKALGIAIGLSQNGFPVPAQDGAIGNIDSIFTHFVQAENITLGESGFTNEMARIEEMFTQATPRSLILINEPVRTSSHEDNDEITTWVIEALSELGSPTILVTHAHSVAELVDSWPSVKNLQTEVSITGKEVIPTYRIIPGRAGSSYGVIIAKKHGYTKERWLNLARKKSQASGK